MTTTISEKDKKLLIKLVIGLIIFGVGYWIIVPLFTQNSELAEQISMAKEQKLNNETKLKTLVSTRVITQENEKILREGVERFYPMMTDTEIDKRITSEIMECGLIAKDLNITLPSREEVGTELKPYLRSALDDEELQGGPYPGIHAAKVIVTVEGYKSDLQKYLDANINAGDKQRVVSYLWNDMKSGLYGMTITMELYMFDDVDRLLLEGIASEDESEEREVGTKAEDYDSYL